MVSTIITVIDGNVGIGTNDPASNHGLDVHGDTVFGDLICDEFGGDDIGSNAFVPPGMIALWYGALNTIPAGWAFCDGSNGTPNLRGKYILGAGNTFNVDSKRNSTNIIYSQSNIPVHNHGTQIENDRGAHSHGSGNSYNHRHEFNQNAPHHHQTGNTTYNHSHNLSQAGNHQHTVNNAGSHEHRLAIVDTRYAGNLYFQAGGSWTALNNQSSTTVNAQRPTKSGGSHSHVCTSGKIHAHQANAHNHSHQAKTAETHQHQTQNAGGHQHGTIGNVDHQHTISVGNRGTGTSTSNFQLPCTYPNIRVSWIMKL